VRINLNNIKTITSILVDKERSGHPAAVKEDKLRKKNHGKQWKILRLIYIVHEKNDFAEESKILLDTDLKIILLVHQNNFV